jgi:hypothetical protein
MKHLANKLDDLGFYNEADEIDKIIFANNNFMLTKRRKSPIKDLVSRFEQLSGQLKTFMDNSNDSSGGDQQENDITVNEKEIDGSQQLDFRIN